MSCNAAQPLLGPPGLFCYFLANSYWPSTWEDQAGVIRIRSALVGTFVFQAFQFARAPLKTQPALSEKLTRVAT